jgi:hypothetical protein
MWKERSAPARRFAPEVFLISRAAGLHFPASPGRWKVRAGAQLRRSRVLALLFWRGIAVRLLPRRDIRLDQPQAVTPPLVWDMSQCLNDNAQQFEGLPEIHLEKWDTELGHLGTFGPQVRAALVSASPTGRCTLGPGTACPQLWG